MVLNRLPPGVADGSFWDERSLTGGGGPSPRFGPGLTVHNSPATTLQPIQLLQASGPTAVLLSQVGQVLLPFPLAT